LCEVADADLAHAPGLVLDALADQTDRLARLPAPAHLGHQRRTDGTWNGQQATRLPLLVQLVHIRCLDVHLGVVPERLELGAGTQVNAQTHPLGIAVARVVVPDAETEPRVERQRGLKVAYREDRRRASESDHRPCSLPARHRPPRLAHPARAKPAQRKHGA
jgi:hypothetical protein